MELIKSFASASRFHDVAFVEKDGVEVLLVACDDGKVRTYKDLFADADSVSDNGEVGAEKQEHFAELVGFSNRCVASCMLSGVIAPFVSSLCSTFSQCQNIIYPQCPWSTDLCRHI